MRYSSISRLRPAELLIALSVVVVTVTIFIPVLASAKGKSASSLLNTKELNFAQALYAESNDGLILAGCLQEGVFVSGNGGCTDTLTGLVWGRSYGLDNAEPGTGFPSHPEALDYCSNLSVDGFSDWRMPSSAEMITAASHGISDYVERYSANSFEFSSTTRKGGKEFQAVNLETGASFWSLIKGPGKPPVYSRLDFHCVR